MKNSKFLLLILLGFLFLSACGAGTEVVNPDPSAGEGGKKPTVLSTALYEMKIDVPNDWTFTEYGPNVPAGPEAFEDIDPATGKANPNTTVVALFTQGESRFTIFYARIKTDETLCSYVRTRHPTGEVTCPRVDGENGEVGYYSYYHQRGDKGPRGGFLFDLYILIDTEVVWERAELVGTAEEQKKILDEFNEIVESIEIIKKGE